MSDQDLIIWISQKTEEHGLRGLASLWEMDPGTLHRDVNSLQAGTPTKVFRALVKASMTVEEREVRIRTLMGQVSNGDQRLRSEIDKLHQALKEASVAVAQAQAAARDAHAVRQIAAKDFLMHWIERLKAAGMIDPDDDRLHGDAPWIIENGVTNLHYQSLGCAAVALAPDDQRIEGCLKRAASLRAGISPEERLNADSGTRRPRPEYFGQRNAKNLGFRFYPDAPWFYGPEDYDLIEEWREFYLSWERKWLGKHEIFDVLASPKRFQSVERFVLIRRTLESFGYRFYSDYWDAHKRSEASYERMKRFSILRWFWPITSPVVVIAAIIIGLYFMFAAIEEWWVKLIS